jgi:hypothetical protein
LTRTVRAGEFAFTDPDFFYSFISPHYLEVDRRLSPLEISSRTFTKKFYRTQLNSRFHAAIEDRPLNVVRPRAAMNVEAIMMSVQV